MKRIGPKTDPCGTPQMMSIKVEHGNMWLYGASLLPSPLPARHLKHSNAMQRHHRTTTATLYERPPKLEETWKTLDCVAADHRRRPPRTRPSRPILGVKKTQVRVKSRETVGTADAVLERFCHSCCIPAPSSRLSSLPAEPESTKCKAYDPDCKWTLRRGRALISPSSAPAASIHRSQQAAELNDVRR